MTEVTYDPNRFKDGMSALKGEGTPESPFLVPSYDPVNRLYDVKKISRQLIFPLYWTGTGATLGVNSRTARIQTSATNQNYIDWTLMIPRDYKIMDMGLLWEASAASGNLYGQLYLQGGNIGLLRSYSATSTSTLTLATAGANIVNFNSFVNPRNTSIIFSSLEKFDFLTVELVRDAQLGSDTLDVTADIYGLLLVLT